MKRKKKESDATVQGYQLEFVVHMNICSQPMPQCLIKTLTGDFLLHFCKAVQVCLPDSHIKKISLQTQMLA